MPSPTLHTQAPGYADLDTTRPETSATPRQHAPSQLAASHPMVNGAYQTTERSPIRAAPLTMESLMSPVLFPATPPIATPPPRHIRQFVHICLLPV
jgi:hypothetical protein